MRSTSVSHTAGDPQYTVIAAIVLFVSLTAQASNPPKPPKERYDETRDVTVYSTGDVRTAGYSGYGVRFEFPGKTFSAPSSIEMGFGCLRLARDSTPEQDPSLAHWNGVNSLTITFGAQTWKLPARHEFVLSTNKEVNLFLGRAFEESLSVTLTPDQLKQLAGVDALKVQLGKDTQDIKGKSLGPLKQLAATLP